MDISFQEILFMFFYVLFLFFTLKSEDRKTACLKSIYFGLFISVLGAVISLFVGKELKSVLSLDDSFGPSRVVPIGYAMICAGMTGIVWGWLIRLRNKKWTDSE